MATKLLRALVKRPLLVLFIAKLIWQVGGELGRSWRKRQRT